MRKADREQTNGLLFIERRGDKEKYDFIWCMCVSAKKLATLFQALSYVDIPHMWTFQTFKL
jgi:hypothetical protein